MTRSRRAVLAACGAGLTTLAGCQRLATGGDAPSYDAARLVALGREAVPRPPEPFPVSVPDAMVSRHRERARELVERVPEQPDVPNGAVVERLRREREAVVERLGDDDASGPASRPLDPLDEARAIRGEAAAVEAAYRAATDAITPAAVVDRRSQLRSAALEFERDWAYRGDDPATAVVVHGALEGLLGEVRPAIAPELAFPENPPSDPFRAGEVVGHLEAGRAALSDAGRLRTRHRDGLSDGRPYRTAISVAAARTRRATEQYGRDLDEYVDPGGGPLPFDRSIEGTALEEVYRRAADGVRGYRRDADAARQRGDLATMLLAEGTGLARLRGLDAVVADVRNDRVTVPESVDGIAAARGEAIDALESAWTTTPEVLAVEFAHWPWVLVEEARDFLRGTGSGEEYTPSAGDARHAFGSYVVAARVAAAVPRTVADVREALRAATA